VTINATLIGQMITFTLLVWFTMKYIWPPVMQALETRKEKIAEGCEYVGSNGAVRSRVQSTPNAIGYAGLGFVDKTVKALSVNGIYPTRKTVSTGKYPIARPLFMFTNGYPKMGSHIYQFVTIHLTKQGQEMVERIGFVPVTAY